MTIRQTIGNMATQGRLAQLLPAGVKNRAFRMLIGDLTRQAKRAREFSDKSLRRLRFGAIDSSSLKVASLVSAQDIEMLLWCLKSLFYFSECPWDLWILDGGLNSTDIELLKNIFTECQICAEPSSRPLCVRTCTLSGSAGISQISQAR